MLSLETYDRRSNHNLASLDAAQAGLSIEERRDMDSFLIGWFAGLIGRKTFGEAVERARSVVLRTRAT